MFNFFKKRQSETPEMILDIFTKEHNTPQGWFNDLREDLACSMYEIDESIKQNKNVLMPFLYAYRFAYAGLYNQGLVTHDEFMKIDAGHFAQMAVIGSTISRKEQVRFQDKSYEVSLKIIQQYDTNITKWTSTAFIQSAKNAISLYEAMYQYLVNNHEFDSEEALQFTCRQIVTPNFCTLYYGSTLWQPEDTFDDTIAKVEELLNMQLGGGDISKLFHKVY